MKSTPNHLVINKLIFCITTFFTASAANRPIDGIILAGGCASISGIDKLIEKNFDDNIKLALEDINNCNFIKIKGSSFEILPSLLTNYKNYFDYCFFY